MIVKIKIVQISLVLNAKTWNVWISLFWKILTYHWNFIRYWEKVHLTLTLKNRRCWWQLSADGTHYAIGWSDQKNLSHRNNWLRVVFVWVLGFEKQNKGTFLTVWITATCLCRWKRCNDTSKSITTKKLCIWCLTRKRNVHSNYFGIIRWMVDMVKRISIKRIVQQYWIWL